MERFEHDRLPSFESFVPSVVVGQVPCQWKLFQSDSETIPHCFGGCAWSFTKQQRRGDISFLADWADKYSPFVEANERIKGCPSYRELLPKYLEYAEQAKDNREFLYIVQGYFFLVFNSGHADMYPQERWQLLFALKESEDSGTLSYMKKC